MSAIPALTTGFRPINRRHMNHPDNPITKTGNKRSFSGIPYMDVNRVVLTGLLKQQKKSKKQEDTIDSHIAYWTIDSLRSRLGEPPISRCSRSRKQLHLSLQLNQVNCSNPGVSRIEGNITT